MAPQVDGGTEVAVGSSRYVNKPQDSSYTDQRHARQTAFIQIDSGGEKQLNKYSCFKGESVDQCAARMVQERVLRFYFFLGFVGVIQAVAAAFTVCLLQGQSRIAEKQRRLMERQLILSREVFMASHRPRLCIRHVWINDRLGAMVNQPGVGFNDGDAVSGSLVVVNVGGSDAIVTNSKYRILFLQSDQPPPGAYIEDYSLDGFGKRPKELIFLENGRHVLVRGESLTVPITGTARMAPRLPDERRLREFPEGGWRIFVLGQITYEDRAGQGRFVGFCRRSDLTRGFIPVDDPDYEYQD